MKKKKEFNKFVLWGREGGKKTLKNKGKKHFSRIGKIGRARQLSTDLDLKLDKGVADRI